MKALSLIAWVCMLALIQLLAVRPWTNYFNHFSLHLILVSGGPRMLFNSLGFLKSERIRGPRNAWHIKWYYYRYMLTYTCTRVIMDVAFIFIIYFITFLKPTLSFQNCEPVMLLAESLLCSSQGTWIVFLIMWMSDRHSLFGIWVWVLVACSYLSSLEPGALAF